MFYRHVKETLFSEELGWYVSYGIAVTIGECEVLKISDVAVDEGFVKALVERCNCGELNPVHIWDVVRDVVDG